MVTPNSNFIIKFTQKNPRFQGTYVSLIIGNGVQAWDKVGVGFASVRRVLTL